MQFKDRNLETALSEHYNKYKQNTYNRINMLDELRHPLYNNIRRNLMRDMYGGESGSDDGTGFTNM